MTAGLTDRCDATASGSEAAQHWFILPGVGELRLCSHHAQKHAEMLDKEGWTRR